MRRTALVTGAASGIGRHLAESLVNEGCEVYGLDIHPIEFGGNPGGGSGTITGILCDVSRDEDVYTAMEQIEREVGVLSYVLNVAGIISCQRCYPIRDIPVEEWNRVIAVNLTGTFLVSQAALPLMREGGCILSFSTEQVKKPNLKSAPYAVSKAGIEMLTRILALEYPNRIRANTIALGSVNTGFIRHMTGSDMELQEKMERADRFMPFGLIQTEAVWKLVRYLLLEGEQITGQTILMDSGMTLL